MKVNIKFKNKMIVCICRRVPETTVRTAIQDGARTIEEVTRACRAGSGCGSCHVMIEEMISEHADCPRVRLTVLSPYLQAATAGESA